MDEEALELTERGSKSLSWDFQLRTKMYIAKVPLAGCDPINVLGKPPLFPPSPTYAAKAAAFLAFCGATNAAFSEDPKEGNGPPAGGNLDARVLSIAKLNVKCSDDSEIPTAGSVTSGGAIAGIEPPNFKATVFAPKVRDDLTTDGTFAFSSAGKPHPVPDLAMQALKLRTRTTIWHVLDGSIECDVDNRGNPMFTGTVGFSDYTKFPSHRAYRHDKAGKHVQTFHKADVGQGGISALWSLPPVGAP